MGELGRLEVADKPEIIEMSDSELDDFADQWRNDLQSGTMDKRKAVFDGEELEVVPNLATLAGTGVKVASPRGFEPRLPP